MIRRVVCAIVGHRPPEPAREIWLPLARVWAPISGASLPICRRCGQNAIGRGIVVR